MRSDACIITYWHGNNSRSDELFGSNPPIDSQALFHDVALFNLEGPRGASLGDRVAPSLMANGPRGAKR